MEWSVAITCSGGRERERERKGERKDRIWHREIRMGENNVRG